MTGHHLPELSEGLLGVAERGRPPDVCDLIQAEGWRAGKAALIKILPPPSVLLSPTSSMRTTFGKE